MKLSFTAFNSVFVFLLLCSVFFISCKKDSVISPAVIDSHITAIYAQDDHYLRIDSLTYDVNGRVVKIFETTTDTAFGVIDPLRDSASYTFTFSGNSSVPTSYAASYTGFTGTGAEQHNLYYDSQNRIIKDSLLNPLINGFAALNYYYGYNLIVYDIINKTDSGLVSIQKDSLLLNASGNVTADNSHYLDYNNQPSAEHDLITFSNYANPLYEKNLAGSLGPFLTTLLSHDFISSSLFSSLTYNYQSGSTDILTYTWTTDTRGRVIKGVEPSGQSGYAFHYSN